MKPQHHKRDSGLELLARMALAFPRPAETPVIDPDRQAEIRVVQTLRRALSTRLGHGDTRLRLAVWRWKIALGEYIRTLEIGEAPVVTFIRDDRPHGELPYPMA